MQFDPQAKLVLAALGMATTLIGTLQAITLNFAFQAYKRSGEAVEIAKTSRPFPYTSLDREKDEDRHSDIHDRHAQLHAAEMSQALDFVRTYVALKESELNRRIDNLPRPPQAFLATYEKRQERIESMLQELRERMGRLEVTLGRNGQ